jgi:mRNA interferase HigB
MILTGTDKLEAFVKRQPRARSRIQAWRAEAERAKWTKPIHIKNQYRSVDFRPNNRMIFDIGGNNYRLVVQVAYKVGVVIVLWVGTHAEYDRMKF